MWGCKAEVRPYNPYLKKLDLKTVSKFFMVIVWLLVVVGFTVLETTKNFFFLTIIYLFILFSILY